MAEDPILELLKLQSPYLYSYFDHTIIDLICVKFISINANFMWSFLDIFIMIISMGLSNHFKLFNNELKHVKGEVNTYFRKILEYFE